MDWLALVWLITKRELRDQFRDWRIIFPLAVLTLIFPLLMNEVAYQAVEFVAKYGETLLVDRLVPFSVLIIGFFPITVSLVVALESFVGEKERGTIEPLLSTPLKDWHMYLGKLLVGVLMPLVASFVSIGFYLVIVSRQKIEMPGLSVLLQLFALTAAHAVLMVSGAIVISVQSTSVKAANLLASFIVIPVAILMQGESALLFWGDNQILWLAVVAVILMAGLLIRVGLAHFQREYLLGHEIDVLSFRWMWQTFWGYFKGQAHSLADWYRIEIVKNVRQLALPLSVMLAAAVLAFWLSFQWTISAIPAHIEAATPENLQKIAEEVANSPMSFGLSPELSAPYIFMHNLRAVGVILLAGLVSFSVLGMLAYLVNLSLIGVVLGFFQLMGYSALVVGVLGLAPHGIFELPALMLASAAMLRIGVVLVTPQTGRSLGEVLLEALADWAKVAFGLVLPLLLVAAIIETYVTPSILLAVL
ncbi:MAG: stage II sporulation protein M [Chloroflexota bacterium]